VAADHRLEARERDHALTDGPLSGYSVRGVDAPWSTGLAGLVGVGVTFASSAVVFSLLRRRRRAPAKDDR
jgi:hypothetical protein